MIGFELNPIVRLLDALMSVSYYHLHHVKHVQSWMMN
jgi:hypothetical protein